MDVLARPFFNIAVIDAPLETLVEMFRNNGPDAFAPTPTPFEFPRQPYQATEDHPPMLLWSPSSVPTLTAFMPQVQSGDYFVVEFAYRQFGYRVVSARSTADEVELMPNFSSSGRE